MIEKERERFQNRQRGERELELEPQPLHPSHASGRKPVAFDVNYGSVRSSCGTPEALTSPFILR